MFRYLEKICPFGKRNLRYYWIKNKGNLHSMAQRQGEINTHGDMALTSCEMVWYKNTDDDLSQNMQTQI